MHLSHRIRLAMDGSIGKLSSSGGIVEAEETYIGRKTGVAKGRGGFGHKNTVLVLVERGGKVCSVVVTEFSDVKRTFVETMDSNANLMTDDHKKFRKIGQSFASHESVNHGAKEYARGNVHTNTIEGVFSVFKLGISDYERADNILAGVSGKRLTY